jgi:hypothetical protein
MLILFAVVFMWVMFKLFSRSRLNEGGKYEEYVRDRRETRRRARSRKREEEKQKNEKNTEGGKSDT